MNPIPAEGVTLAQVLEQFGMPGACSQGVDSLVPELLSEPLAAM